MNKIIAFVVILFFSQCSSISGFYSGYKQLTEEQKRHVIFQKLNICSLENNNKIHAINATQLKECLKLNKKSLVYTWSPHCYSEVCILIAACQDYCDKNDYELYVVADYYDWETMEGQNVAKKPIFTIDHKYYKTDYANKYQRLFIQDLTDNKQFGKNEFGRFFIFEKDKLVERRNKLF